MTSGSRVLAACVGVLSALVFIALGTIALGDSIAAEILFGLTADTGQDAASLTFSYPFTIQNAMWIMFFLGCGEIWSRVRATNRDTWPLYAHLLPEDSETVLRARDLGPIYRRIKAADYDEDAFLPRLLNRTILQFQTSRSVDQANTLLNSTMELCQHEIDLRYNMLRYLVWLIPTMGFIGTVVGIAAALNAAGAVDFGDSTQMQAMMPTLTKNLGVAFYTTLLALSQSALLVFALQITQAREEKLLNRAGQYSLDNLINRLYDK